MLTPHIPFLDLYTGRTDRILPHLSKSYTHNMQIIGLIAFILYHFKYMAHISYMFLISILAAKTLIHNSYTHTLIVCVCSMSAPSKHTPNVIRYAFMTVWSRVLGSFHTTRSEQLTQHNTPSTLTYRLYCVWCRCSHLYSLSLRLFSLTMRMGQQKSDIA